MASPVGHALAGIAIAWTADLIPGNRAWRSAPISAGLWRRAGNGLTLACGALAAAPDLDLLIDGLHRSITHSLTSVAIVATIAALVAVRNGWPPVRVAAMCAVAWGSHIVLDWVSADQSTPNGIQILWPFDDRWFISGWDIFPGTERRRLLSAPSLRRNAHAFFVEVGLMAPVIVGVWLIRVKALARFSSEVTRRNHPAK